MQSHVALLIRKLKPREVRGNAESGHKADGESPALIPSPLGEPGLTLRGSQHFFSSWTLTS